MVYTNTIKHIKSLKFLEKLSMTKPDFEISELTRKTYPVSALHIFEKPVIGLSKVKLKLNYEVVLSYLS